MVDKKAQDRSDQVVSPSSNRFRVRNKHRGVAAGAAGAAAVGAAALASKKTDLKDKDGYKVSS